MSKYNTCQNNIKILKPQELKTLETTDVFGKAWDKSKIFSKQ